MQASSLNYILVFLASLLFVTSCTKEIDDPVFPLEPVLTLQGVSSAQLISFQDTLVTTLTYTDGDGDLGGFDGNSRLFVLDQRLSAPDEFALQALTPNGEALSIEGNLVVSTGPYFVLGNAQQETFSLEFWITDRAGNESNHVISEPITVSMQ